MGGQAQVDLVEDIWGQHKGKWARKKLRNISDPKARERFEKEIRALQSIHHPNILKIIDSDAKTGVPYYVAEYCEKGSLQQAGASRFRGDVAATNAVLLPIVDALVAAHNRGVTGRWS